jgi:hypothetical protein
MNRYECHLIGYHGTDGDHEILDDTYALRAADFGCGHYLSLDAEIAATYGCNVKSYEIKGNILELPALSDADRKELESYIFDCVPRERLAGYAPVQERVFSLTEPMDRAAALELFEHLKVTTAGYYHDRAKVLMEPKDGRTVAIRWRDPSNLGDITDHQLWVICNEFDVDILGHFGFDGFKSGSEIVVCSSKTLSQYEMPMTNGMRDSLLSMTCS